MTIAAALVEQAWQRAGSACEYCGVTETDSGGPLTVDHFRPVSRGGTDAVGNLLYCCYRCNLYKADYWPDRPGDPELWSPRQQGREQHFLALADGTLYPLTAVGHFTLRRLRLSRPPLVAHRQRASARREEASLLARYSNLLDLLEQVYEQHRALLEEQHALLEEHRAWLKALQAPPQDSGGVQ